ncbi:hypothetical protein EDB19DRAFT_1822171 [Suillus lakei]|nr:hypothetical protein EDB19DRAFT_1822171 [Suillus lakei]
MFATEADPVARAHDYQFESLYRILELCLLQVQVVLVLKNKEITKSRSKKNKAPVIPAPTFELSNSQPTFAQWEAHGRYRFSPPIVPPGTEPDLQVLNNSFVAAAKGAHALPDPNHSHQTCVGTSQRHVLLINPNASQGHRTITTSNVEQTRVDMSQHHIPVINPNASQGHRTVTTSNVEDPALSSTTSTTVLLPDANFFQNLDPALQLTGPSGTESEQSNMSKDDLSGSDEGSGDKQMGWGEAHGHHSTHPGFSREELPPQPRVAIALPTDFEFQYSRDKSDQVAEKTLAVGSDSGDDGSTMDREIASQKQKAVVGSESDDEGPKATQLGWYSPRWKSFLEDAKSCSQPLSSNGLKMVNKLTPLYDDLATWRSDLKKIAISITPSTYGLSPPDDIPVQERAAWVQAAAVELLDNAIFRKEVPLKCLALVCTAFNCVFQGLEKNSNGKFFLKFTAKEYESVYLWLLGLLGDVMSDPYHGPKLVQQLHEWAKIGWAEASKLDGVDTSKHRHLRVQLD